MLVDRSFLESVFKTKTGSSIPLKPKNVYWKNFWQSIEDVGPKALPIIILIGFLVGVITSFQATIPLKQFGAREGK